MRAISRTCKLNTHTNRNRGERMTTRLFSVGLAAGPCLVVFLEYSTTFRRARRRRRPACRMPSRPPWSCVCRRFFAYTFACFRAAFACRRVALQIPQKRHAGISLCCCCNNVCMLHGFVVCRGGGTRHRFGVCGLRSPPPSSTFCVQMRGCANR